MARNLKAARQKVRDEGECRACQKPCFPDPAHVINKWGLGDLADDPRNVVPLCRRCHDLQHAGRLSLLPLLVEDELEYVTWLAGFEGRRLA